ncbi:hypothetical protein GUITHDRAFT_122837 [Guillardia theta CCMP2712]|uniref:Uncharacterized protein n=1 Tax=Guillardia theta (strain CCMP2712) TaxID=905079 RepID=L1I4Y5_GUITC|nr:hypothetical protein GUITHDRAFT_122837 [Guillardia theta CCMP2712]EKX30954.1 hypothetical protein GUITHDRAFT_122837 [Guillardia theta CCMP2712]|eukprot:XP_005817934.1 hypothetical protein GUITHDRAFT_122837 [Guillardia theta CCMP2712]
MRMGRCHYLEAEEEAGQHCLLDTQTVYVSRTRPRRNVALWPEKLRRNVAPAVLLLSVVVTCGMLGTSRDRKDSLESEGEIEYEVARAKAKIASDELEVKNSRERLNAIVAQLGGDKGKSGSQRSTGLARLLYDKAEDYRLQAEVEAASVETAKLHGKTITKKGQQQADIVENDDRFYADALRKAAAKRAKLHPEQKQIRMFLQQYRDKDQLLLGKLHEENKLKQEEALLRASEKRLYDLEQRTRKLPHANSKVEKAEEEAMEIEKLLKQKAIH